MVRNRKGIDVSAQRNIAATGILEDADAHYAGRKAERERIVQFLRGEAVNADKIHHEFTAAVCRAMAERIESGA